MACWRLCTGNKIPESGFFDFEFGRDRRSELMHKKTAAGKYRQLSFIIKKLNNKINKENISYAIAFFDIQYFINFIFDFFNQIMLAVRLCIVSESLLLSSIIRLCLTTAYS
jgi:Na+-transporting NADH:ubiquinone oxidoreductase subunit NqrF